MIEELTVEPKMIRKVSEPRIESLEVDVKVIKKSIEIPIVIPSFEVVPKTAERASIGL